MCNEYNFLENMLNNWHWQTDRTVSSALNQIITKEGKGNVDVSRANDCSLYGS